jgi:hypothetical protein
MGQAGTRLCAGFDDCRVTIGPDTTTLAPGLPDQAAPSGVRSLEVRWFFPGPLNTAVAGWFERFPAAMESRDDAYLLSPQLRGLSVKLRAGGTLDVKVYRGSPGILDMAGQARGRLQSWQKWSFPGDPLSQESGNPAGWRPVGKTRRVSWFSRASGQVLARGPRLAKEPRCAVELTEICTRGEAWWSLGFEATGPVGLLGDELEATASLVFAEPLPRGVKPSTDDSRSYAEWLGQWPNADGDTSP